MSADLLTALAESRIVAVVGAAQSAEQAVLGARACLAGGIRFVEVPMRVPSAVAVVKQLSGAGAAIVGVGAVTEAAEIRAAAGVGARFAVSPHFDAELLAEAKARGLLVAMGAATATEAMTCYRAGVEIVNVFPVSAFGGPDYVRTLRGPLPFLKLLARGGVNQGNLAAHLDAGASGLALEECLLDGASLEASAWERVTQRARKLVGAVAEWRKRTCR